MATHSRAPAGSVQGGTGQVDLDAVVAALRKKGQHVEGSGNCLGWAAYDTSGKLAPWRFNRRPVGPKDVSIQISHVGMCHSDIHTVKGEWGPLKTLPLVPGHEIVGTVTQVGDQVIKFKVGQRAGVGCFVNCCGTCPKCTSGRDNFCPFIVYTYNSVEEDGSVTQGGFSTHILAKEHCVVRVPDSLPLAGAAPLMCAGTTMYTALTHYGLDKPGLRIAIVGLGGLGHMGVKLAKAMGAEVTVISRSQHKEKDAKRLGADSYLASTDKEAMTKLARTYNGIVDTVSAPHDLAPMFDLLDVDGTLVMVGLPSGRMEIPHTPIVQRRLKFGGSLIGSTKTTQEMLELCAKHNITADVEVIEGSYINEAVARMLRGDVKFRFVIDIAKSVQVE